MKQRAVPPELASPFLEAKVQPPVSGGPTVRRQRLLDLLDHGADCRLTVVSGPPGAGKTSLLSDWVGAREATQSMAWLTLDRHDNDPVDFWVSVVAALASVSASTMVTAAGSLAAHARSDARAFLMALGTELAAEEAPPTLVLDDYHVITNDDIHDGVRTAVQYLADRVRLVVGTRISPPLHVGRLRASGQLCEIRFDDLRFTADEGDQLVRDLAGTTLDAEASRHLVSSSEGWAAAIYVGAISSARPGGSYRPPAADVHLADYLVEEVLANQPPARRDFLLQTSVLDALTPTRCDAVTASTGSAAVLRELERSSQFVRRFGDDADVYTYHALLRDLLRAELAAQGAPIAELHARASAVAEIEGDPTAAIHHAFEAGTADRAAGLIGRCWIDATNHGRFATVMAWIDRWSEERQRQRQPIEDATVLVVGAWAALHAGRLDDVERWLGAAEDIDHHGPLPDGTASLEGAVAIVRTSHRRRIGAIDESVAASQIAVTAEPDPRSPWRAVALVGRGVTLFWAGHPEARAVLEDAVDTAHATGLSVPVILGEGHLALLDRDLGDRPRALDRARRAVTLARSEQLMRYDQAAVAHLALGLLQLDAIQLDEARSNIATSLQLATQGGERLAMGAAHLALAQLAHLGDRQADAATSLADARSICDACSDPGVLTELIAAASRTVAGPAGSGLRAADLTHRERVILRYLASELSMPAIARELHVSPNTVKSQAASIRTKLGVSNRADVVRVARERGLLG